MKHFIFEKFQLKVKSWSILFKDFIQIVSWSIFYRNSIRCAHRLTSMLAASWLK